MNPWIRRLGMMLGILIPGLLMVFLQVPTVLIVPVMVLAAVAILFAARSITVADLKGLHRGGAGEPAEEPAGPVLQGTGIGYQLRQLPSAFRDLGGLLHGRRRGAGVEDSRLDAIDRELERTIAQGRGKGTPLTVRRPVSRAEKEGSKGDGGDPFLDLLDGALDPAVMGDEVAVGGAAGSGSPRQRGTGIPVRAPKPGSGGEGRGTGVPQAPALEIQFEDMDMLPPGISLAGSVGGIPPPPSVPAPPDPRGEVTAAQDAVPAGSPQTVKLPEIPEGLEMVSFATGTGGSMDDLLAALKEESTHVKRKDESSLLRGLKGVPVQGKDLVDELTSLLKSWRK